MLDGQLNVVCYKSAIYVGMSGFFAIFVTWKACLEGVSFILYTFLQHEKDKTKFEVCTGL